MKRYRYAFAFVLSILVAVGIAFPGWSADFIYLRYGFLGTSIPIQAIENFSNTGTDPDLNFYLRRLNENQRSQIQNTLKATFDVDLMMVSQFTYTASGVRLLEEIGDIVRTASGQNGFSSVRSAAILTAANPGGASILNFLRNLPVDMEIDVQKAIAFQQRLTGLLRRTVEVTDRIIQDTQQMAQAEAPLPRLPIDPSQSGSVTFSQQTLTLVDPQRDRSLTLDLYQPDVSTPAPLIVVSNGLGARRDRFTWLATHLASHGFAVAIPDHPGSDRDRLRDFYRGLYRENFDPAEFTDRPLDISFLLDELEQFQGIDLDRVGVFGYSFGGTTAFSLAGADIDFPSLESACRSQSFILNISLLYQCQALAAPPPPPLGDDRIKAVYAFLPFGKSLFGANLNQVSIPVLWEAADEDLLTPMLEEQVPAFRQLTTPERYFVVMQGLPHARISYEIAGRLGGSSDRPSWEQIKAVSNEYHCALTLTFFKAHVANEEGYRAMLSPAYATALADPAYPIGLVQSLDAEPTD